MVAKDHRVGELLTAIETLKEENDRLRSANHQLKTQCESQKAFMAAFKKLSSPAAEGPVMKKTRSRTQLSVGVTKEDGVTALAYLPWRSEGPGKKAVEP